MDLNRIAVFVAVVETESFTGAASKLGVPKSSVSRSVSQLEDDLGVRLLNRTTRKLSLTEAGRELHLRALPAIQGLEEAGAMAMSARVEPRGTVRLTAPPEMAGVLPRLVVEFTRAHPKVSVSVSLSQRVVDLVAEGFDLGVRAGKLEDSSLIARKLASTDLALFAAPSYLARREPPKSMADLATHECVLFRAKSGRNAWTLTGPRGEESVEVTGQIETDALFFVAEAAISGAGIALLPEEIADAAVRQGLLARVLHGYVMKGAAYSLVMPSTRLVPGHVLLFRDYLTEHLTKFWDHVAVACTRHMASRVTEGAKAKPRRVPEARSRARHP
jgi:DNA-binding transcriptional LysR family regulator